MSTDQASAETTAESQTIPTEIQVSGTDSDGRFVLSVLAKRTYVWDSNRWLVDPEQEPLAVEPVVHPDHPDMMWCDTDLHPIKLKTDLVVKGSAQGKGRTQFQVVVSVGNRGHFIDVIGDRHVERSSSGQLRFTPPQPVESVPLTYAHAYGGVDKIAEAKYGNPFLELHEEYRDSDIDLSAASPFRYPRNPAGRGYCIEADSVFDDEFLLPNLEDPGERLSPQQMFAGDLDAWSRMPVPTSTDWLDYGCFPRNALLGCVPMFDPDLPLPRELVDSDLPAAIWDEQFTPTPQSSFAGINGATAGLQFPLLKGPAKIQLQNIHPDHETWKFLLPDDRPVMKTDGRQGKLNATEPVMHTVVIDADQARMTVLWRGSAIALRPYLPDELARMPFVVEWNPSPRSA